MTTSQPDPVDPGPIAATPTGPRWSRRAVIGAIAGALVVELVLLVIARSAQVLLLSGYFFAWGASCAAAVLLAALLVRRLRGGRGAPPWLVAKDIATLTTVAGGGLALGSLGVIVRAGAGDGNLVGLGAVGLALAIWATLRLRVGARGDAPSTRPSELLRGQVLLLAVSVVAVWVPREAGQFSISLGSDRWKVSTNANRSGGCSGGVPRHGQRYRWQLTNGGIQGDLGQLLAARIGRPAPRPNVVRVTVSGRLDVGGFGCYLPLYRSAAGRGRLSLSFHYRAGGATCHAHHSLSLTIDANSQGIGACPDLLKKVAGGVLREIHRSVDQTL
jgi:hypothetical protein